MSPWELTDSDVGIAPPLSHDEIATHAADHAIMK